MRITFERFVENLFELAVDCGLWTVDLNKTFVEDIVELAVDNGLLTFDLILNIRQRHFGKCGGQSSVDC